MLNETEEIARFLIEIIDQLYSMYIREYIHIFLHNICVW